MDPSLVIAGGSSGSLPPSAGKGAKATPQNFASVRALYDKPDVDTAIKKATERGSVFKPATKTDAYDLNDQEPTFCVKKVRSSMSEDPNSLHVKSSLTAEGATEKEAFLGDEEMQAIALQNKLMFTGIARDTITYTNGNKRQGLALQVAGVATLYADNDMPPGALAELIVPTPSKINSFNKAIRPNWPAGKVVLEMRPYNPRSIESDVMAVLRNYSADEDKFKKGMDPKYRTTDMWINFCEALYFSHFTTWAVVNDAMIEIGVLDREAFKFGTNKYFNLGEAARGRDVLLGIMCAFGFLTHCAEDGRGINNVKITKDNRASYLRLKQDLVRRMFTEGKIADHMFGFDRASKTNIGVDEKTNKPKKNPIGNMVTNQMNHHRMAIGGMSDAIRRKMEWIIGKVIHGAQKGSKADILL
jgi:hypothetical protein